MKVKTESSRNFSRQKYFLVFVSGIILLFFLIPGFFNAQTIDKKFNGQLICKLFYFGYSSDHGKTCHDITQQRVITVKDGCFQVKDFEKEEDIVDTTEYFVSRFFKEGDTLFETYYLPLSKKWETKPQFPLKKGDSISGMETYLVHYKNYFYNSQNPLGIDSLNRELSSNYITTNTNMGDTAITILNKKYFCYRFEFFGYNLRTNPGPSDFREIVFVDKESFLPVREEYWNRFRRHPCIPEKQWKKWFLHSKCEIENIVLKK